MHIARYMGVLAAASLILLVRLPSLALQVTLDSGAGSQTIVDNDAFDLDITVGTIEFDVTVGGKLAARGRVHEEVATIVRAVNIAAIPPDTHAVFRNTSLAPATFTITVDSSSYSVTGPPLGATVFYTAEADDPTPDDVEITSHSVACLVQPGSSTLATVTGTPITPPVPPAMQPVLIGPAATTGADADGSATGTRVVFTFAAGPGDEIRIPDSELYDGTGLEVWVYNRAQRCTDLMNNRARKVAGTSGKAAAKCVKGASKLGGSSTQCTTGLTSLKIDTAEAKLFASYDDLCDPPPPWGVNGGTCCNGGNADGAACTTSSPDCDTGGTCRAGACISGAAERAVRDLGLDIFGGTALVGADEIGKCETEIIKRAGKVLETRWKSFRKCKKNNIGTIVNDASLIDTCLGPPQPDDDVRISTAEQKVADRVTSRCLGSGIVPVGSAFPGGKCSDELDANFATCVNQRVACRFCLAVNVADDIVPALDCDAFDDGVTNGSCP